MAKKNQNKETSGTKYKAGAAVVGA